MVLGASKDRGSTPDLNYTCREVCVISLATFTILVCRWIASDSNPADEPSRSKRYRPRIHSDVDQCGTDASESTRMKNYAGAADLNKGRTDTCPKTTRRRRSCTSSSPNYNGQASLSTPLPPRRVVLPRADPSRDHGSMLHRHAQQVSGLFRNDEGQAEAVGKVGRDGGGNAGTPVLSRLRTRSGRLLDGSDLSRAMPALEGYRQLAPRMSRGPLPWVAAAEMMGAAMVTK